MTRYRLVTVLLIAFTLLVTAGGNTSRTWAAQEAHDPERDLVSEASEPPPTYGYEVVNAWPHDPEAFTQGLLFHEGLLYESTGLQGRSSLRKVALQTGNVLQKVSVPEKHFAEGLALYGGKLYQLTWKSKQGFVYDLDTFEKQRKWTYRGEGWGLTTDGHSLIMSDGTNRIRFLDPKTFKVRRTIRIHDRGRPRSNLNELEFVKGEIYANIWQTDTVARIDPTSGRVLGWIYFSGLLRPEDRDQPVDVLNGIAYDAARDRLFVTGKLWPKLFEVRLRDLRPE